MLHKRLTTHGREEGHVPDPRNNYAPLGPNSGVGNASEMHVPLDLLQHFVRGRDGVDSCKRSLSEKTHKSQWQSACELTPRFAALVAIEEGNHFVNIPKHQFAASVR